MRISADGTHASAAPFADAAVTYYPGSPELPGILMGVSANSGDDARPTDDGRSGRSTPPDDDDDRLAAYAAIYELVVSSLSTPRATIGWMNRMEYHLTRYHDAIPVADPSGPPRLRTETDRWRLSLCAIGPKIHAAVCASPPHRCRQPVVLVPRRRAPRGQTAFPSLRR